MLIVIRTIAASANTLPGVVVESQTKQNEERWISLTVQQSDRALSCDGSQAAVGRLELFHLSFLNFSVGNQMRNLVFIPRPSTRHLAVLEAAAS